MIEDWVTSTTKGFAGGTEPIGYADKRLTG
jgi:hypothetical protein